MRAQDLARLVVLAALFGASYLFMRTAAPTMGPVLLIELRTLTAGAGLCAFVLAAGGEVGWKRFWRQYLVVGTIGVALPFTLIAQAVTVIDASTAAILNALSPLFASIFAAIWIRDPMTPAKSAGIALCLLGIAVLVGWVPVAMTPRELHAVALCMAAPALYGYTIVYTKVKLKDAPPIAISAGTLLVAAAALLPLTPTAIDFAAIPPRAWLAAAGLAVFSTAFAFILYYRLIADVGPVKAITVTLLMPVFGMLWGVALLGEPLTPGRIAGCAITLAGCSLILGIVRLPLRRPAG